MLTSQTDINDVKNFIQNGHKKLEAFHFLPKPYIHNIFGLKSPIDGVNHSKKCRCHLKDKSTLLFNIMLIIICINIQQKIVQLK